MADQGQTGDFSWAGEVSLDLLGPVRLCRLGGDDLTPKARKTRAVVAVLACSRAPVTRIRMIDVLWGDRGEDQAKASLRQALYELREMSACGYLQADRHTMSIGPKCLPTDVSKIERLIAGGDAAELASALAAISPPLMSDLDGITPELDDWLRDERQRLNGTIVGGAVEFGNRCLVDGQSVAVQRLADALERLDPLDERVAQLGIRADLASGDCTAATRRRARLAKRLRSELGVDPAPATEALLKASLVLPSPQAADASSSNALPGNRPRLLPAILGALALLIIAAGGYWLFARGSSAAASPTVAVLPFDGIATSDDNHFAAGVSDEILNLLSHQRRFRVIGRVSSEEVARQHDVIAEARRLGITHLLDGSVQSSGGKLLVIVRLTSTSDGTQLWSERYERQAGDIFAVQGEIARAVASRMALSLGPVLAQQTSPDVYDRYLAARQLERDRRESNLLQAQRLLKEAIALDDRYAPAFAELSQVTMLLAHHPASYGEIPYAQARSEAEAYARKAIALDPNLGEGWAALGFLDFSDGRSEAYYARAVALSPQRADFHRWYAQSLKDNQKYDQAIDEYKRAVAIDPLWEINNDHLVGALLELGHERQAKAYAERFLKLSTDRRAHLLFLRSIANLQSRLADTLGYARELMRSYPDERQSRFTLASALANIGERRQAERLMADDAVGRAALSGNWDALATVARESGPSYWDAIAYFWNTNALLLASGRGSTIVHIYDQSLPGIRSGRLAPSELVGVDTALALRQTGRTAEADHLEQKTLARAQAEPNAGYSAQWRNWAILTDAFYRGQQQRGLDLLTTYVRSSPRQLLQLPSMSLRWLPVFHGLAGNPRFEAVDEQVRALLNKERAKASLPPISRTDWVSDPKTLLTKN